MTVFFFALFPVTHCCPPFPCYFVCNASLFSFGCFKISFLSLILSNLMTIGYVVILSGMLVFIELLRYVKLLFSAGLEYIHLLFLQKCFCLSSLLLFKDYNYSYIVPLKVVSQLIDHLLIFYSFYFYNI